MTILIYHLFFGRVRSLEFNRKKIFVQRNFLPLAKFHFITPNRIVAKIFVTSKIY